MPMNEQQRKEQSFYFPLLFLLPNFSGDSVEAGAFEIAKRRWDTSIFDLATLATKHRLHLSYQAMDVFLSRCNMELCISGQTSLEEASVTFRSFRLALYAMGVSPFISPFVTTYSINDYSGINSRDSESLRENLPPGMEEGLTSETGTLEAWPLELSFQCMIISDALELSKKTITEAAEKARAWLALSASSGSLRSIEETANAAPKILPADQSVLHVWSAIEALFPSIRSELTFRIALYLAQLAESGSARLEVYERVRSSYKLRSNITHGSQRKVSAEQWQQTWKLLTDAYNAVIRRGHLPTEEELVAELLS